MHISEATLLNLGSEFDVEEAHGDQRDAYIAKLGIKTYFIIPRDVPNTQNQLMLKLFDFRRRFSFVLSNEYVLVVVIQENRVKKCRNYWIHGRMRRHLQLMDCPIVTNRMRLKALFFLKII